LNQHAKHLGQKLFGSNFKRYFPETHTRALLIARSEPLKWRKCPLNTLLPATNYGREMVAFRKRIIIMVVDDDAVKACLVASFPGDGDE